MQGKSKSLSKEFQLSEITLNNNNNNNNNSS